jgi:hypothetical protein
VILGLGLCLAPFVLLAVVAASFLTLNRDATVLRQQVMAATDGTWKTKVQLSVGGLTLGAVRTGLGFVPDSNAAEAQLALATVRRASVGVYEPTSAPAAWSRKRLFIDTDRVMQSRGWTRLVGVADNTDTVLIYVPKDFRDDGPVEICLAAVSGKELVVVSTEVNASALAELVAQQAHDGRLLKLQLAKLRF